MNAVYHHVEVRVILIAMRHDENLMLIEAEIGDHAIGDSRHGRTVCWIANIERNRNVVDGLLDAVGLMRSRAHENGGGPRISGRQVPRFDPVDAIRRYAVAAALEILAKSDEASALRDLADHRIPRITARTSERIDWSRSRAGSSPAPWAIRVSWFRLLPMRPSCRMSSSVIRFLRARGMDPRDTSRTYRDGGIRQSRARATIWSHSWS
jgi:hypothetical protein